MTRSDSQASALTLDVECFEALAAFDEEHRPEVLAEMVRLFTDDARGWLCNGHLVGDAVLCETARRLRASLRASDSLGRYGGEKFVVVAPGCSLSDAAALAERFRAAIGSTPINVSEHSISVSMSFGVAGTWNMSETSRLFKQADEALYLAKQRGRNRVEIGDRPVLV